MGWNRPVEKKVEKRGGGGQGNVHLKGLVAGVIIVIGAGIAVWFTWPSSKPQASSLKPQASSLIKTVAPAVVTSPVPTNAVADTNEYYVTNSGKKIPKRKVMREDVQPDGSISRLWSDGRRSLLIYPERIKAMKPPRYSNLADKTLAMFAIPGKEVPPLPIAFNDAQIREALNVPINIDFNQDSDEVIAEKQSVLMLREELKKHLDAGGTVREYMEALQARQSKELVLIQESRRLVMEAFRKGEYEHARESKDAFNEYLKSKGLPPLHYGTRFNQILEERSK